jgi:CTP synthase
MEIAELPRSVHPFFLGTQFHPELLARPLMPHPLFTEFMKAAKIRNKKQEAGRKEVVSDGAISVNADLIRDIEADIGDLGE